MKIRKINDIFLLFKEEIKKALSLEKDIEFDVLVPKTKENGDLSTNVILKVKNFYKDIDKKEIIVNSINKEKLNIKKVEIVEPGFINIFLDSKWITIVGDMVIQNGLNIIDKSPNKKIVLNIENKQDIDIKSRAESYYFVLKNILSSKGYDMIDSHKLKESDNQVIKKNINLGKLTILRNGVKLEDPIESILTRKEINFWSISKTFKSDIDIPLEVSRQNSLGSHYFKITYLYERTSNVISILEKEGYNLPENNEGIVFNDEDGKELIFSILKLEDVISESIKFLEPYKLFDYIHTYSELFHRYNSNLLLRTKSKEEVLGHLYIMKVVNRFISILLDMIGS
ncbi:DALR anticodon-binding domain-containing protein [Gottschalkia purinilytica]|uniref:DALR anticodon-binding domain-containing protein n=1 Tax=Gottschalkia purinilytica TaxID=1503 RepID=UPI001F45337A|nr:DALR anticodon-binding domain-containing protein [Gottschalkia purinilytica]